MRPLTLDSECRCQTRRVWGVAGARRTCDAGQSSEGGRRGTARGCRRVIIERDKVSSAKRPTSHWELRYPSHERAAPPPRTGTAVRPRRQEASLAAPSGAPCTLRSMRNADPSAPRTRHACPAPHLRRTLTPFPPNSPEAAAPDRRQGVPSSAAPRPAANKDLT